MAADPTPIPPRDLAAGKHPGPPPARPAHGRLSKNRIASRNGNADVTRAGMIWVAVSTGLVVLVLLIIFILQNQDRVSVKYFGAVGDLSLGMALFIAAVAGGILVAISGAARVLQLRNQRRHQRAVEQDPSGKPAEDNTPLPDKAKRSGQQGSAETHTPPS